MPPRARSLLRVAAVAGVVLAALTLSGAKVPLTGASLQVL
jgi:hypothetical protein